MRALQPREAALAVVTAVVMLGAVSFLAGIRLWRTSRDLEGRRLRARVEEKRQQIHLGERPALTGELELIRGQLPRHPEGRDLKSDFARQVQSLASQSRLRLTGLTPDAEIPLEELKLHQSAVRCSWTGTAEALVDFLHRLHELGAVADVRELRLRNRDGSAMNLSGTFVIDFAYSRYPGGEIQVVIDSPAPAPEDESSP